MRCILCGKLINSVFYICALNSYRKCKCCKSHYTFIHRKKSHTTITTFQMSFTNEWTVNNKYVFEFSKTDPYN